jgi:hypothetical protein
MTLRYAVAIVRDKIVLFVEVFILFIDISERRTLQEPPGRSRAAAYIAEERLRLRETRYRAFGRGGDGGEQVLE